MPSPAGGSESTRGVAVAVAASLILLSTMAVFPAGFVSPHSRGPLPPIRIDGYGTEPALDDVPGNSWAAVGRPASRNLVAIAYDDSVARVVLFGGYGALGATDDTWTFDPATGSWADARPLSAPSARTGHLAYDAVSRQAVLFGGSGRLAVLNDTWAFDAAARTWTAKNPALRPPGRAFGAMVFASRDARMVLFGGDDGNPVGDTWTYSLAGDAWQRMTPTTAPSPRSGHAMAYDAQSNRVVLFGGFDGTFLGDTWVYEVGGTWTNRAPASAPSPRSDGAMAYDAESDRVVLFGGVDVDLTPRNDTWAYDVEANAWTQLQPTVSPPPRFSHGAAYAVASDRIIVFGGRDAFEAFQDTWSFDLNGNAWSEANGLGHPPRRKGHVVTYDSRADRTVLFGGILDDNSVATDTWSYDYETDGWSERTPPAPVPFTVYASGAYDAESGRTILFGGVGGTWAYDHAADRWADMNPPTEPPMRVYPAMAYDAESDRVVVFGGGVTNGYTDETWTYDFNGNVWVNVTPAFRPSPRSAAEMAYDAQSDRLILFGGATAAGLVNETWAYDVNANTWTNRTTPANPNVRTLHAMAYDAAADRVILFGGWPWAGQTWAYDYETNTWTNRQPVPEPRGSMDGAMAYDPRSDRIVFVSGEGASNRFYTETWSYEYRANRWVPSGEAPPPRCCHAVAYDAGSDRTVLFGGAAPNGTYLDETWAFDAGRGAWRQLRPPVRPSGRADTAMAYDTQSDRIILFGGGTPGFPTAETWAFDTDARTWTALTPTNPPPARSFHAMAYDAESDRVILFGGLSPTSGELFDTWAYDYETNAWTDRNPASPPFPRYGHGMAYDASSDRIVLFGGLVATVPNGETWTYDQNANVWSNRNPPSGPAPRSFAPLAYDASSDRAVLFGGGTAAGFTDETWSFDADANVWANMAPSGKPPVMNQHAMAYDAESDRVVLVGGLNYVFETWLYHHPNPPTAPGALQASAGDARASLAWQPPLTDGGAPVTTYNVYRGTSPGGETFLATVGNVLSHTDVGLTNGVTYYYQVTAANGIGEGPRSNEASATPLPPVAPTAPRNPSATTGDAQVSLAWGVPGSDGRSAITNYRIYRGTASGSLTFLVEVGAVLAHVDVGLTNGQRYFYQVSAVNGVGEGPRSSEVSATPAAPPTLPGAPQALAATPGNGTVALAWDAPASDGGSPVTNYRVYRGTASGSLTFLADAGSARVYDDVALTNGVTYHYQVSAVNAVGEGPRSAEVRATPSSTPVPLSVSIAAVPDRGLAPLVVLFEATVAGGEAPYAYAWAFGDGGTSTAASPSHTFARTGTYAVTLIVTDAGGNTATSTLTVVATSPAASGGGPLVVMALALAAAAGVAVLAVWLWRRRKGPGPPPAEPPA